MKNLFMRLRIGIYLIVAMLLSQAVYAENQGKRNQKNQVYFELLGSGIGYTINYERKLDERIFIRSGFEAFPHGDHADFLIPAAIGAIAGENRLKFEYGGCLLFGTAIGAFTDSNDLFAVSFIAGFRWEFETVVLRLVVTPVWIPHNPLVITAGFSVGIRF